MRTPERLTGAVRAGALVALVLASAACSASAPTPGQSRGTSGTSAVTSGSAASLPPLPAVPAPLAASSTAAPVRLQVPAIGVDTGLEDLALLADGSLAAPSTFPEAGWYKDGVKPGDPGPAIVAGHVDSTKGPAVFFELAKLKAGDQAIVTRADGSVVTFVVQSAQQYAKAHFPTDAVYGPTPTPELRLITCTGIFDRAARSYEDNLVVTAALAS